MSTPPKVIVSPTGTSILTNVANADERKQLLSAANATAADCGEEMHQLVRGLEDRARAALTGATNVRDIRRASAELNAIVGISDDRLDASPRDVHFLISTDTLAGRAAASLVAGFLADKVSVAEVFTPRCLSTRDRESFGEGMKDLLRWCDEALPGYRDAGYEIVFNLTGGFKSMQGVLNTVGMLHADRIVYIFESGGLIEIPRLPIRIDVELLRENTALLLRLSAGDDVPAEDAAPLPSALTDVVDGTAILSLWGALVWSQTRDDLLADDLVPLPGLVHEKSFARDFRDCTNPAERVVLQQTLAKAAKLLRAGQGGTRDLKADGGLQYSDYENRRHGADPIGHFRVTQGLRVSCVARNGELHLRHYGAHDYVNDDP